VFNETEKYFSYIMTVSIIRTGNRISPVESLRHFRPILHKFVSSVPLEDLYYLPKGSHRVHLVTKY